MAAAANRDTLGRDVVESLTRGRQRFMEHSAKARSDISACFDKTWFSRRLDLRNRIDDPILVYFSDQGFRAFSINPLFDEAWYLDAYEDVAASVSSGMIYSGFTHFVIDGLHEGRAPNATMALAMSDQPPASDVRREDFDGPRYLDAHPFARKFLSHFPILGVYEFYYAYGRYFGHRAPERQNGQPVFDDLLPQHFDANYYKARYLPEEANAQDALPHYIAFGAAQGYSPSDAFDETWYRLFYTDVAAAVQAGTMRSAFHHYVVAGREEQRRPKHDMRYALEARMSGISEPKLLQRAKDIEKRMQALPHAISATAAPRVWFCLPNLNPDLSFGGYKAVFEFMKAVVRSGRQIGIFVTEDNSDGLDYFLYLEKDEALKRVVADAPYVNRSVGTKIEIGPNDIFVVYSVWDAYVVQPYLAHTRSKRFLLFAQEYEPIFYECGSARALTESAYDYAHVPLFNSRFLTNFFRGHGIGAFETAEAAEGRDFHVFEHVPTRLKTQPLSGRKTSWTLAFYARPEMHAARNLFELGYLALRRLCADGVFDASWQFFGLGGLTEDHELPLGGGHSLQMRQKMPLDMYETFMNNIDIGLSLMFAPHPSVVPFEFAATGAVVVTNVYENRAADDLEAICSNIVPCQATIDGVAAALREAVARAGDLERREANRLRLTDRRWDDVFDAKTLDTVFASLN
ncbi:rhamnosyltransferase WsaF family glycosyltransferase [Methylobacterium haplocladii]|uniref:Uncharacterized protein n=1 Tax=Methylobacterium haplocladii TaxID=1176176 RepID=A0A512IPH9_9HYPH|nr:hypothetical protein [Methylobacterium haplocladii]GEO99590.1 hypothetical protein MHA02_19780 [Methylobacterium haplocladii]GJD85881.1 hypothetical protein HPGCJGGD_3776 [Methylobacterium haplocladii]GLS58566.1 hypothetical protein GCM10007887_12300 [Methylobacterium haplocladii]